MFLKIVQEESVISLHQGSDGIQFLPLAQGFMSLDYTFLRGNPNDVGQLQRGNLVANPSVKCDLEATPSPGYSCELAAWNVTRLSLAEMAGLRRDPATRLPPHITPQFIKNSDDQTLASLVAIYAGIESLGKDRDAYRDWGIVSASQFIGRGSFAATLHKYCKDGPWGVSVQVIPHNMLHSIASTISLTLPCVGPCLGAGGGVNGEIDALLIAVNLLSAGQLPGVWVTWSVWDPELVIDEAGKAKSESNCVAGALALIPMTVLEPRAQMDLRPTFGDSKQDSQFETNSEGTFPHTGGSLTSLLQHVSDLKPKSVQCSYPIHGGLQACFQWRPQHDFPLNREPIPETLLQGTEATI